MLTIVVPAVRRCWRRCVRSLRLLRLREQALAISQVTSAGDMTSLACPPCNQISGVCRCAYQCGHPDCGGTWADRADDVFRDELATLLDTALGGG